MKYNLYSVRDKYTGFMPPSPNVNNDAAKRDFAFAVNNNPGIMNFSPADYDLYKIGTMDTTSGIIEPCEAIEFIINGYEVLNEK